MMLKSQRNEETVQDKEPKVRMEPSKKRNKSKVREPSCNPSLVGRAAGEEEEGAATTHLMRESSELRWGCRP